MKGYRKYSPTKENSSALYQKPIGSPVRFYLTLHEYEGKYYDAEAEMRKGNNLFVISSSNNSEEFYEEFFNEVWEKMDCGLFP